MITVEEFKIYGVDGIAHIKFVAIVKGERVEYDEAISRNKSEDVSLVNEINRFIRSKEGEIT